MEVVDSLDVQTFGSADVLENVPVSTGRPSKHISKLYKNGGKECHTLFSVSLADATSLWCIK